LYDTAPVQAKNVIAQVFIQEEAKYLGYWMIIVTFNTQMNKFIHQRIGKFVGRDGFHRTCSVLLSR